LNRCRSTWKTTFSCSNPARSCCISASGARCFCRARQRLGSLSKALGDKLYLDGDRFTAGDLIMSTVLRILRHTHIVTSDQRLVA
jgi:glutathione S-transferase